MKTHTANDQFFAYTWAARQLSKPSMEEELEEWIEKAAAGLTEMIDDDIKEKYEFYIGGGPKPFKMYDFKAAPNIKGFSDYYPDLTVPFEVLEECPDCFLYCDLSTHSCP